MASPFIRNLKLLISCFGIVYEPNCILINPKYSYLQCQLMYTWLIVIMFKRGTIDCTVTCRLNSPISMVSGILTKYDITLNLYDT